MTKKERILEILSRKEASTPVGDALLNAAKKTEAFARSRPGVGTVAGSVGGGLLGALLSRGSRKKRLRDILLGMGIGGAGGYAAGKYMPPLTGAGKEEYDPVVDGARLSQEPVEDNSIREEKAAPQKTQQKTQQKAPQKAPQKAQQKAPQKAQQRADALREQEASLEAASQIEQQAAEEAARQAERQKELDLIKEKFSPEAQMSYSRQPTLASIIEYNRIRREKAEQQAAQQRAAALRERQEAGQRVSQALREQGRKQAIVGGMTEFGTQFTAPGGYDELLGTVGGAVSAGANKAVGAAKSTAGELVTSARDIGRGVVDLGPLAADAMKEKRDVATGKKLPADVQAEYDRLLKGR